MTCRELLDRLPDDGAAARSHAAGCPSCKEESEAYGLDLELLVEGFLSAAGEPDLCERVFSGRVSPRRARHLLPVVIAAAALLGVLALLLVPAIRRPQPDGIDAAPQENPDPDAARRRETVKRRLTVKEVPRGMVTAVANEIGLVVISIGKDDKVLEGDEFIIARSGETVARIQIDRADRKWSAGKVVVKNFNPRVADNVLASVPVSDAERKAVLDYLFSFRARTEKDGAAVRALLDELDHDQAERREKAMRALVDLGAPARLALRELDLSGLSGEAKARLNDVRAAWAKVDEVLEGAGWERDVDFLVSLDDPRAYDRVRRMLSEVPPFSADGFPPRKEGWEEKVRAGWSSAKDRLRWNARADRYEERP